MAGYVFGAALLAFGVWRWRQGQVPAGSARLPGTVVEELSRRSSRPGRRTVLHAPRVSYCHPRTGAVEVHEPTGFGQRRWSAGEAVDLVHDPATDRVRLPEPEPLRALLVCGLVGIGLIVAQWFDGR